MMEPSSGYQPNVAHDIVPSHHLARLAGLARPRIVIVGDGLASSAPAGSHDRTDTLWGQFQRAFLLANPGVQPEFLNRAIPGARFSDFEKSRLDRIAPEGTLPWLTDPETRWLDHVADLRPDLLIMAFGMEDGSDFSTQGFIALQRRIDGWVQAPDRLFVTAPQPSRKTSDPALSGPEGQMGRLWNAHYVRSWAVYNGYGLIDLGRAAAQAVQGNDPRVSELVRERGESEALPSKGRNAAQDFGVTVESETLAEDLASGLTVQLGAQSSTRDDRAELRLRRDAEGQIVAEFADLPGALGVYMRHRFAGISAMPRKVSVFARDVFVEIVINDQTVFFGRVRRHGGPFTPSVVRADGARSLASVAHYFGRPSRFAPVLTDVQAFGGTGNQLRRLGGDGGTHPTSLMCAAVIAPLMGALSLTVPQGRGPVQASAAGSNGLLNRLRG